MDVLFQFNSSMYINIYIYFEDRKKLRDSKIDEGLQQMWNVLKDNSVSVIYTEYCSSIGLAMAEQSEVPASEKEVTIDQMENNKAECQNVEAPKGTGLHTKTIQLELWIT